MHVKTILFANTDKENYGTKESAKIRSLVFYICEKGED